MNFFIENYHAETFEKYDVEDLENWNGYEIEITTSGGKNATIKKFTAKEALEYLQARKFSTIYINDHYKQNALTNAINNWQNQENQLADEMGFQDFTTTSIGLDDRLWHPGINHGHYKDHETLYNNTASDMHLTFIIIVPRIDKKNKIFRLHLRAQVDKGKIQLYFSD